MKKYIINNLIDKLKELKDEERKVYICDLDYELWESERLDGTITYNTYTAREWIKQYFEDIGEVWEEIQFNYDKDFLQEFNPFDNSEKFMLLIVCEASGYLLSKCEFIADNWDEEITLSNNIINKIIRQLKKQNDESPIYI